jgi:hypothetical protein
MALLSSLLIILIIIIIAWSLHHWYKTGEMPDAWAYRVYQNSKLQPAKHITPTELYAETEGYENNHVAREVLRRALALESTLDPHNPLDIPASIDNDYTIANTYRYHVAPNDTHNHLANRYYRSSLNHIRANPAAALAAHIPPERIILHAVEAMPELEQEQIALMEQIHAARGLAQRQHAEPYYERPLRADPQNVHDSNVQHSISRVYKRIRELNGPVPLHDMPKDLIQWIQQHPSPKSERALYVLENMGPNYLSSLDDNEDSILQHVWARINNPSNIEQKTELKASLLDSLADSAIVDSHGRPTSTVCINGRCNRIINSLTLLDSDPVISEPVRTVDILRNEILTKSSKILNDTLTDNDQLKAYEQGDTSPELERSLNEAREKINELRSDYPDAKPQVMNDIIRDALAGVN